MWTCCSGVAVGVGTGEGDGVGVACTASVQVSPQPSRRQVKVMTPLLTTPPSQSWPSAGSSFSMTSPQIVHFYLAEPLLVQVGFTRISSISA